MADILMYSGGLDSWIASCLYPHLTTVYVTLGHRYQRQEMRTIELLTKCHGGKLPLLVNGPDLGRFEEQDGNIPFRNLLLVSMGCYFANAKDDDASIALVCQKGEQSIPDRSYDFFQRGSDLLSLLAGRSIKLWSVFGDITKAEMVKEYLRKGYDPAALKTCYSCYNPSTSVDSVRGCGECGACFRKWLALTYNGIECLERFDNDPYYWSGTKGYIERAKGGEYDEQRSKEILSICE